MNCPACNIHLVMSERQGVEIDYCPQCRGVWLDRGELDKIIERSAGMSAPQAQQRPQPEYRPHDQGHSHKKKKHGGFLGELFDFD